MLLAHHLHVHVDEVTAGVTVSPSVQAGQVRLEALVVVDGRLGHRVYVMIRHVHSSSHYYKILQLDTAGKPDMMI